MAKYETNHRHWTEGEAANDFWSWQDGGDLIRRYVNRSPDGPGRYYDAPSIELKIDRLIDAIGMIADKAGVNLLEVFEKSDLELTHRLHVDEG